MSIKVLIADDHPPLRHGIRTYLDSCTGIQVVGEACNGDETLEKVKELEPDVLLLDLNMPGLGTEQVLLGLKEMKAPPRVLVFTAYGDASTVLKTVRGGVDGYLLKGCATQEIAEGIRAVATGKAWFSPAVAKVLAGSSD